MLIKPGPFSSACCVGGFAFATPIPSARAVHLMNRWTAVYLDSFLHGIWISEQLLFKQLISR